ncbi:MAG: CooT family nickel-binding protein [Anaerolineae bacterium]|nr:CooT family nickel-binding protein [Anaerolineae bacterium]
MCESKIYLVNETGSSLIMENVTRVQHENGIYLLIGLLGEQKLVRGCIDRVDFINHEVYLKPIPEPVPTPS